MALSNIFGWNKENEQQTGAACGTACGASDKPAACGSQSPADLGSEPTGAERRPAGDKPAACGTACGASDKPAACGTACGASDK